MAYFQTLFPAPGIESAVREPHLDCLPFGCAAECPANLAALQVDQLDLLIMLLGTITDFAVFLRSHDRLLL